MATITLKDIPEELHRKLRKRAELHGRSLNKEIIMSLEQVTSSHRIDLPEYLPKIKLVRRKTGFEVTTDSIQDAIESGRP